MAFKNIRREAKSKKNTSFKWYSTVENSKITGNLKIVLQFVKLNDVTKVINIKKEFQKMSYDLYMIKYSKKS